MPNLSNQADNSKPRSTSQESADSKNADKRSRNSRRCPEESPQIIDPVMDEVRQKWHKAYGNYDNFSVLQRDRRAMAARLLVQGKDTEALALALRVSGYRRVRCSMHRLTLPTPKAFLRWCKEYVDRYDCFPTVKETDLYYIYKDTTRVTRHLSWVKTYAENHDRILDILREGGAVADIIDEFGGSFAVVRRYLKKHGITDIKKFRNQEARKAEQPAEPKAAEAPKEAPPVAPPRSYELGWTPEEHAQHGKAAVLAALFARGEMHDPAGIESVSDLLADIMHYCDQEKVDFYEALHMGRCYWKDEKSANNQIPTRREEGE